FIDPFVSFAAMLSEEIGLTSLSTNALSIMEEKTKFRTRLKNLPTSPVYHVIQNNLTEQEYIEQYKHQLPLILKTPVSNGSKDVLLAKTIQEFKNSLHYFEKKFPGVPVLMEEYLEGTQYLIEVIVYKKRISIVAVIEQEILHSERFIITGYVYPAVLKEAEYENLQTAVTSIINELGLMNGNCHLEMRNSNGQWKLIEINPRMSGGAMNRIIQEGTGINLVKETIKLYLGEKPIVEKTEMNHVYAKFLTINTKGRLVKVTGKNRASNYEGVKEVYVKPKKGAILTKPYSLGNRYAYVIAASSTAEQAKDAALKAAREIKFYLEPL
ncbi:MAG TPA: ATP-grasp domain-containing protein, partial [Hanamia sp.]|nr:ATP-grasp domain-containing protein [Hanamia sp.]